jgi:chromosome segregation ATPase
MANSVPENFDELREAVKDLRHRMDTVEDKVMMERLEDLAIEDEIEVVRDLVEHGEEDIKAKINLLDELEEKYENERLDDKLRYLYSRIKELEQAQGGESEQLAVDVDELREKVDDLSVQVAQVKQQGGSGDDEDLEDIYDKLYLLRDKVKKLESDSGTTNVDMDTVVQEDDLDDVYDKLHAVRDKIKEMENEMEQLPAESGGVSEDQITELKDDLEERLDKKHGEKVKERLGAAEERITEMVEETEQELADKIQANVDGLEEQLRETLEALEYQVEEQEEAMDELRDQLPDAAWKEDIEEQVNENAKAVEYALEEHEVEVKRLKDLLRSVPEELDDEDYVEMQESVSSLEDRLEDLKERLQGDTITEEVVTEVLQETDAWKDMEDSLDAVHTEMRELAAELENDIEGELSDVRGQVSDLTSALGGVTDEVDAVSENVDSLTDNIAHVADHLSDVEERHASMRDNVQELRQQVNAIGERGDDEVAPGSVLEALEYSSDEIWNRMEEILVRMEHLQDDIDNQSNRIDGMAESQNIFEGEIGRLMENQKELNSEFEKKNTRIQQQMDLLLEALEEGLSEEPDVSAGLGIEDELQEEIAEAEEQIAELQRNMDHIEVEAQEQQEPHENMKQLTQMVLDNQRQMNELSEQLDKLQEEIEETSSSSPTIIE